MDGFLLLLLAWLAIAVLCYVLYTRQSSTTSSRSAPMPSIRVDGDFNEAQKSFVNELLNWLIWGDPTRERSPGDKPLSPVLTRFVLKSLNEAAQRINKDTQPELHFDSISRQHDPNEAIFRNFKVNSDNQSADHLSIDAILVCNQNSANEGIRMQVSVNEEHSSSSGSDQVQMRKRSSSTLPVVRGPSTRRHTVVVEELSGEIETRLAPIAGELFVISCFKNRPYVQLRVADHTAREEQIATQVRKCIISAVLNFSIGELLYPDTETSARASRARLSAEYRNMSFLQELYTPTTQNEPKRSLSPKFPVGEVRIEDLLVANRLRIQLIEIRGVDFTGEQPFVCIEMDEPGQRFLSVKAHHAEQPKRAVWEQNKANFEFAVSSASGELLFEVFSEEDELQKSSSSTIRERMFHGTAILSISELRQSVMKKGGHIQLRLQGRPFGYGEKRRESGQDGYGELVMKCSFFMHREIERPSAPQPTEEYAQMRRNTNNKLRLSPSKMVQNDYQHHQFAFPSPSASPAEHLVQQQKKSSITTSESSSTRRKLSRQKQHYIYNVTDEEGSTQQYDHYHNGSSSSPERKNLLKVYDSDEHGAYSSIEHSVTVRKTVSSDTNALFQFDPERLSASPAPTVDSQQQSRRKLAAISEPQHQQKPVPEVNGAMERDASRLKPTDTFGSNDAYEHLFKKKQQEAEQQKQRLEAQSAMEIFDMPEKLKRLGVGDNPEEFERIARDRDRTVGGKKRERSFFEKVRARLAGPVKLLPRHGKRAKSLDEYENRPLEEAAVSVPTSRDQSQTRYEQRKGSQQQLFVNTELLASTSASTSQSTSNLVHSPTKSAATEPTTSQLVLELVGPEEEGPRFYSIPAEVGDEPAVVKLMQSGKKLHIFEGHIFVAVKSRGRVVCAVCGKKVGGNFTNRQAYQCRDCRMVCHKSCHQRTSWVCTSSNIFNMHIEEVDWPEFLRHNQLREFISAVGL